jgi:large subunit ribosomal protein L4e
MAASRPLVTVQAEGKEVAQVAMPAVLVAGIRPDIVHTVHRDMAKNSRQPYAVKDMAGMEHSADSWGTGRAVARIPRISGGGTSRSGQGAFGNMCRKGRMFAPTKIWRKWHRNINQNQRRYAVVSALAATAIPSLVLARGHRINQVAEVPLVVSNEVESIKKTALAVKQLEALGAYADVEKVTETKKLRAGVGKARNRRHVQRRGPLIVYNNDDGITQAFRNLAGVELCQVTRLNLLQLAPGGHLGRFVIWTQGAFEQLDNIYGTARKLSTQKKGYKLPRPLMTNTDLVAIINSDKVQSKLNPAQPKPRQQPRHKNPLKNLGAMVRLNPYALSLRRAELKASTGQNKRRKPQAAAPVDPNAKRHRAAKQSTKNYKRLTAESEYDF